MNPKPGVLCLALMCTSAYNNMQVMNPQFPFVDPEIALVLKCQRPGSFPGSDSVLPKFLQQNIEEGGGLTLLFPAAGSMKELINLAWECDDWMFASEQTIASTISDDTIREEAKSRQQQNFSRELARFAYNAVSPTVTAACTMLALNGLESAIRQSTGYTTGKAPLLKRMILQLAASGSSSSVERVCELLLLAQPPNENVSTALFGLNFGLNFRNLFWHGFVVEVPRPWLALVLILTELLLPKSDKTKENHRMADPGPSSASYNILDHQNSISEIGRRIPEIELHELQSGTSIEKWLPSSGHIELYRFVLKLIRQQQCPASCCAILSVLLEHGLRIDWCRANDRPDDRRARPGAFYVTLDGHGQRKVHDLLLHPLCLPTTSTMDENDRLTSAEARVNANALISEGVLPGSTVALLTDLFCSSCGGPNIRATVSHGLWDDYLCTEWTTTISQHDDANKTLWNTTRLLLWTMEKVSSREPISYRPMYSYTAVTRRSLHEGNEALKRLEALIHTHPSCAAFRSSAHGQLGSLPSGITMLDLPACGKSTIWNDLLQSEPDIWSNHPHDVDMDRLLWTSDLVYLEHEWNERLSSAGMTRRLLQEVIDATVKLHEAVTNAVHHLETDSVDAHNKRKRKSWLRTILSSQVGLSLYTFAFQIALLSLLNTDDNESAKMHRKGLETPTITTAVRRSRMVVSTVDTFLIDKTDRAMKATTEYCRGKANKAVATYIMDRSKCGVTNTDHT